MQISMPDALKKEISKYLDEIKSLMPGDLSSKRKYLHGLKSEIYDYAEENSSASMGDIIMHFGEKEEVAKMYADTLDIKTINKRMRIKRAVVVFLVTALVVWGVTAAAGSAISRAESDKSVVVVVET